MSKPGINKLEQIKIVGILNVEDLEVEIEGEEFKIKDLIKEYDGYDIEIKLSKEDSSIPTIEE